MPLPAGVETVTVTMGEPLALLDGTPIQGTLVFTGPDMVTIGQDDVVLGGSVAAPLVGGEFTVTLAATDATGMSPTGWTYKVQAILSNAPGWTRYISLPKATPNVILADILVPDPITGEYVTLVNPDAITAAVATHAAASDPHGDRAWATEEFADQANLLNLPGDQNLLAWAYDPDMAGHVTAQSTGGVGGRITLTRIVLRKTILWSNIWVGLSGVDTAATLSNCYLGVYGADGTRLGVTADISSQLILGSNAKALPFALQTPFTAPPGIYYFAMLLNGTWTTNTFHFKASGAGISVNAGLTAPNLRYANMLTGQTSLPASLNLNSQVTTIITTGWGSQWYGIS